MCAACTPKIMMQKSKNYDAKRIILTKIINTFQYEEANTIDKGEYNVIDNSPSGSPETKSISTWVSRTMANINNLLIH